jgi:hypothetical protein
MVVFGLHVPCTQAELEAAIGQEVHGLGLRRQQHGVAEVIVEHVGANPEGFRHLCGADHRRHGCEEVGEVIGHNEVESVRHTWLTPSGLTEALPKPDKRLSAHPAITRLHPYRMLSYLIRNVNSGLVPPVPDCRMTESAEALRPATALPVALVGRNPHCYYGLSAPVPTLAISQPTLPGVGSGVAHAPSFVLP